MSLPFNQRPDGAKYPYAAPVMLAVSLPFLIAFSQTPNATLFNQLAAFMAWGLVLAGMALCVKERSLAASAVGLASALMAGLAVASTLLNGLPGSLMLSQLAFLLGFALVHLAAQRLCNSERAGWWAGFCWAMLLAGIASVFVSVVQVFWPELADAQWIARSGLPGRAIGNLRQPNHLASLLVWSCIAAVYLAEAGHLGRGRLRSLTLPVLLAGLVFADVLSASRTGLLAVLFLAVWGAVDKSLSRFSRICLMLTPLMVLLSTLGMSAWAHANAQVFGAEARLAEGAGSPSRIAILRNALSLLINQPLFGVGAGEFNLAWTMSPFPDRPTAFFDHTHDLPMQLLVELGVPCGLLVLALLGWTLWRNAAASRAATGGDAHVRRTALMFVLMIGLHSLLEYPLWYAYFLLPTAFALGIGEAQPEASASSGKGAAVRWSRWLGAAMIGATLYAAWDYNKAVVIYAPPANAASLEERIKIGQRSLFFSHLADYAAATNYPPGPEALAAAKRTAHNLIDARLMMAWARSLHATGDTDRARYVVARLREFRNAAAQEWLDECLGLVPGQVAPFQCEPPKRDYSFREMR